MEFRAIVWIKNNFTPFFRQIMSVCKYKDQTQTLGSKMQNLEFAVDRTQHVLSKQSERS